jgi:quinoprotein glucose dehydrogenase
MSLLNKSLSLRWAAVALAISLVGNSALAADNAPSSAEPGAPTAKAGKKKPRRSAAERYAASEARHKAQMEKLQSNPNVPTTQELLEPDYPPRFDAAEKAIDNYKVASGLKMSVFAAEPQLANPVCLWIDQQSRFWVCETWRFDGGGPGWGVYDIRHMYERLDDDLSSKTVEQRMANLLKWNKGDLSSLTQWPDRLRLIGDRNGDGKADFSSIFAQWQKPLDGLASGVITRPDGKGGEDVYVTNIPSVYKLKDSNHDGKADSQEVLSTGYGVRYSLLGHDLHGLAWGPDGRLYFSIGDRGSHVVTKEGKVLDYPDEGAVFRCDPDGSNLEVFAHGLRNPQKLVFDSYGDLFTGDNNADYGEPARWVYIVDGGDTGWRIGYQHIQTPRPGGPWLAEKLTDTEEPGAPAYRLPPIAHIASGPSGCAYYPGVGLSEKYYDHFFLTDFRAGPSSVIWSFALKQKGASFELVDRDKFVERLVATDIAFAPDGNAYVTDWNAGWTKSGKGRIYRISDPVAQKNPLVAQTKKLISEGMSKRDTNELKSLLAHPDMRVRMAAQFELVARGGASAAVFSDVAEHGSARLARLHAIWGLGQLGRKDRTALAPLVALLGDQDDEVRSQSAKVLGEAKDADAYQPLVKLLSDSSSRVRFFAGIALGHIGNAHAVPALLNMLSENGDKDAYLRHAGVMGLAGCGDVNQLVAAGKSDSRSVHMGVLLAFRRMHRAEVSMFLHDSDPLIVTEAARAINDAEINEAQPELAKIISDEKLPEPALLRALNANFRLGKAENAAAVAHFAGSSDAPEILRVEALQELAQWDQPRGIDRVVGIWRPFDPPTRDPSIARDAARPLLAQILSTAPDSVRLAGIDLAKKIGLADPDTLFKLVTDKSTSPAVGADALSAMKEMNSPRLREAVDHALANGKGALRTRAINLLAGRPDAVQRLEKFLAEGSIADQQAVLDTLGEVDQPAAQEILSKWMDKLLADQVNPALVLDLEESAGKCKSDPVRAKLKQYDDARTAKAKNDKLAGYTDALMGGDPAAGRKIFYDRQDVSCMRCHKLDGQGGVAGPDLTGVALRHDRDYLLQSVIDPNAKVAPGFESVNIRVKQGRHYTGVVKSEDDKEITLDAGDGATIRIVKSEIDTRNKALSPMPENISQTLTRRDLRNLVAFLAEQKTPTTQPQVAQQTTAKP